jgi:hypothetical protein
VNTEDQCAANTDRELWRKGDGDGNGMSYYEPSIHATEHGAIGINVGGYVHVREVEVWHGYPDQVERLREDRDAQKARADRYRDAYNDLLRKTVRTRQCVAATLGRRPRVVSCFFGFVCGGGGERVSDFTEEDALRVAAEHARRPPMPAVPENPDDYEEYLEPASLGWVAEKLIAEDRARQLEREVVRLREELESAYSQIEADANYMAAWHAKLKQLREERDRYERALREVRNALTRGEAMQIVDEALSSLPERDEVS